MTHDAAVEMFCPEHPKPGLWLNLPFKVYLAADALSQSKLKGLRKGKEGKPSDAMTLGSVVHAAFLEPEAVIDRVAVWKRTTDSGRSAPRRGFHWDRFKARHTGCLLITPRQFEVVKGVVRSLRTTNDPMLRDIMADPGPTEVSVIGRLFGVTCKARCDKLCQDGDHVWDLKTCHDLDMFWHHADRLGYPIQAWWYQELFGTHTIDGSWFGFILVETEPPYTVQVDIPPNDFINQGMFNAQTLLKHYRETGEVGNGKWPSVPDFASQISRDASDITVNGVQAFPHTKHKELTT